MNSTMLQHPSVQTSFSILKKWGVEILASATGALACGETGDGRLLEPTDLFLEIKNHLTPQTTTPMNVMVTSGGTREAIDGVRSIMNTSTGRTGSAIAEQLVKKGYHVTFVHAEDSAEPANKKDLRELSFVSFKDLQECLREELSQRHYDVVVHAAAVGDFSLESIESQGKILPPGRKIEAPGEVQLHLTKNAKLVDELKTLSKNPKLKVIAFKLTNGANSVEREAAIRDLAQHSHADFIVHNDLSEIDGATGRHRARLISTGNLNDLRVVAEVPSKAQLAVLLENVLEGKLS
jgi:phosphopantothenoylcysteine decarboxylase/phosphopantothenate--cysteine ligase